MSKINNILVSWNKKRYWIIISIFKIPMFVTTAKFHSYVTIIIDAAEAPDEIKT